jgi:hypothetical protein
VRKYFILIAALVVSLPALVQAAETALPSALVRAIIRVESGGNRAAPDDWYLVTKERFSQIYKPVR